jgi:hypothetical protein
MPEVASGDFVVQRSARGGLRLKLIACRQMLNHMTPARLLARILGASWDWGGQPFELAPSDPHTVHAALVRALGEETAGNWIRQYVGAVAGRRVPRYAAPYVEALAELVVK